MTISKDIVRQTEVRQATEKWNSLSKYGIKPISKISCTSKRYQSLSARIREPGLDNVLAAMDKIADSNFLQGKNKKGWMITFDWFVLPNNFPKVFEGNYDNNSDLKNGEVRNEYDNGNDEEQESMLARFQRKQRERELSNM